MALKVKVNDQLLDSNNSSTVHLMPCKISHNGSANVSAYFTPYIQNQLKESSAAEPAERKVLEASFRGHPLQGQQIQIPQGYTGIILDAGKKPLASETETRNLIVDGNFKNFTCWNWDYMPTTNDSISTAMDWLALSNVIHGEDGHD